jgi:GNAT superfamily N-acetyltransferase
MPAQPTLAFLLDTNAVITLEPYAGTSEANHRDLADFLVAARANGHRVVVHPANGDDLRETVDDGHRSANLRALRKYELVAEPAVPDDLFAAVGSPATATNDHRDVRLLAALVAGAATHLVTSDEKLIKRATKASLGERLLRPGEALDLLRRLHPVDPAPPPRVESIAPALLDLTDPILDSLRIDYAEFDEWFRTKVAPDPNRRAWVVLDEHGGYRALAIVKRADDHPLEAGQRSTKISTFKVDEHSGGEKLGELLLKTVLNWAHEMRVDRLFVTVIKDESKDLLVRFLEQFGFVESGRLPGTSNEFVFEKSLEPSPHHGLGPLEYHVLYGPPAVLTEAPIFVIPIQPRWYLDLFPDSPVFGAQTPIPGLVIETGPFGNALRKAYLSNASIRSIPAGATVLFYRSADGTGSAGGVHAIGVVEATLRTDDPVAALGFVGRRTVYSAEEVAAMCEGGLIAVLFRQDRFVSEPWTLPELIANGVLNGPPQAIMQVRTQKGRDWVAQRLSE